MSWFSKLFNWKSEGTPVDYAPKIKAPLVPPPTPIQMDSIETDTGEAEKLPTEEEVKKVRLAMKIQGEVTEIINRFKGSQNTKETRRELLTSLIPVINEMQEELGLPVLSWDAYGHLVPPADKSQWLELCSRGNMSPDCKVLVFDGDSENEVKLIFNPILVVLVNKQS